MSLFSSSVPWAREPPRKTLYSSEGSFTLSYKLYSYNKFLRYKKCLLNIPQ